MILHYIFSFYLTGHANLSLIPSYHPTAHKIPVFTFFAFREEKKRKKLMLTRNLWKVLPCILHADLVHHVQASLWNMVSPLDVHKIWANFTFLIYVGLSYPRRGRSVTDA